MIRKIQKFGGAMFTPVLLFSFAGVIVGLGTLFTSEVIMGSIAAEGTIWSNIWNLILSGGWTVFNQLPLLFVVGLPIGLADKQNARAAMEALVVYLTFNYFLNFILSTWGPTFGVDFSMEIGGSSGLANVANIKTLDMGMMGALLISGITVYIHNKYFDKELPEWLGTFSGSTFVYMVSFFAVIPVAFLAAFIWPKFQHLILSFQGFLKNAGSFGVWVFILLERLLIPFGLHHLLYAPIYYDSVLVPGGIYAEWARRLPEIASSTESLKSLMPEAGFTSTGFSKVFGAPGIALAMYKTAREDQKTKVKALLIPVTLTAIVAGVTEPLEFTFLFIAPVLFVIHALLAATLSTVINLFGIVGVFSGGFIEFLSFNFIPLFQNHWKEYILLFAIGIGFTFIWYIVFKIAIIKMNLMTPGRSESARLISKEEYRASRSKEKGKVDADVNTETTFAEDILFGLGGAENIESISNCVTRLRVNVLDKSKVLDDDYFKSIGAHGAMINGQNVQVIIGMKVPQVREDVESLL